MHQNIMMLIVRKQSEMCCEFCYYISDMHFAKITSNSLNSKCFFKFSESKNDKMTGADKNPSAEKKIDDKSCDGNGLQDDEMTIDAPQSSGGLYSFISPILHEMHRTATHLCVTPILIFMDPPCEKKTSIKR